MNIFRSHRTPAPDIDDAPALQPVIHALESAFDVPIPTMKFNPHAPLADFTIGYGARRWKPALALAAAALIALAAIVLPLTRDGRIQSVSARELLSRSAAASQPSFSYHLVRIDTGPEIPGGLATSEFWFEDANHNRADNRTTVDGVTVTDGGITNGSDVWWYNSTDGAAKAVHGGPSGPIHTGTLSIGAGIDLLSTDGSADSCRSADILRQDSVIGRVAYVVRVTPTPASCSRSDGMKTAVEKGATNGDYDLFWIDGSTYIALRSEHYTAGVLASRTQLTLLETNISIPPSTFVYTPSPGVTVHEVQNMDELCKYYLPCPKHSGP